MRDWKEKLAEAKHGSESDLKCLRDEITSLQDERKFSEKRLHDLQHQVESLQKSFESSNINLEKSQLSNEQLKIEHEKFQLDYMKKCSDLQHLQKLNKELESEMINLRGVSQKRKTLIDEMAIEIQKNIKDQQERASEYSDALNKMSEEKCNEISQCSCRISKHYLV